MAGVVILVAGCTLPDLTSGLQTPDSLVVKTRGEPVAGRYALIDVQVLDKSGNPVSGVTVELYRKIKNSYGSYYVKEDEAKTDSFGWAELSFFSPKEGECDLYVQVKGNPFLMENFSLDFISPKWLFVVWMCGDNNLWGYSDQDLEEMRNTNKKNVSVVVFYDGGGTSDGILVLDNDGNWKAIMGITGVDLNSGSYEDLEYWLKYVFENFSSTYRALIMWDHGSAWIGDSMYDSSKAISFDDTSGSAIAVKDLRMALENVINGALDGQKLDILGFDACLMGSLEVIYELRNTAHYIVASSFNEPADGWNYSFLDEITPDSTQFSVAEMIVDSYRDYYSSPAYDSYRQDGLSLAVYDTSQVEGFVSALDSFTYDLKANLSKVDAVYSDVVKSYIDYYNRPVLVDLGDFIDKWVTKLSIAPDPSSFVVHSYGEKGDRKLLAPVSIFMPESRSVYGIYENDYMTLSFPNDTQWDEFLVYWLQ